MGTQVSFGWQTPENGFRIFIAADNSKVQGLDEYCSTALIHMNGNPECSLGLHYYRSSIYTSSYVGICRIKDSFGNTIHDADGNELLLKVVPRFKGAVTSLLSYIRDDDEFERYLAPQTISNRHMEKETEAAENNELFRFFEGEKPIKVNDDVSAENSIITATVFLSMLKPLCRRPLMGRMLKCEENLTGKVRGKVVVEKNIRNNTMRGRDDRFHCSYLRYTDDIPENRILKSALRKAARFIYSYFGGKVREMDYYSSLITYCTNSLKHITDVKCSGNDCKGLSFTGCYSYYKPVISAARMVLDEISIEANGTTGTTGYLVPYAISMDKLFEVYVRAYLKNNGIGSYITGGDIVLEKFDYKADVLKKDESAANPARYIAGPVKPDIILKSENSSGETVYTIFDVKYKCYERASRSDRLQLLAYSLMFGADNIGIIFPQSSDEGDVSFTPSEVASLESRKISYHQLCLRLPDSTPDAAEYIKNLF